MNSPEKQTTSTVLMIRPANFGFNEETFETCPFQTRVNIPPEELQKRALLEFNGLAEKLKSAGVDVLVFEDTPEPKKPDAIFPNNWISFHDIGTQNCNNGATVIHPMLAPIRRQEIRMDVVGCLVRTKHYPLHFLEDLTYFVNDGKYLEGTGSMVLDRESKIAYACLSPRTHREPLEEFAQTFGYETVTFHTRDKLDMPIYHTNVVMSVGEKYAVACLEAVKNSKEKRQLAKRLQDSHELINISLNQLYKFCGNILEVQNQNGEQLTVMSDQALKAFRPKQLSIIKKYSRIIHVPFYTIETVSGGSVRCTMAEIFPPLPRDYTTGVL